MKDFPDYTTLKYYYCDKTTSEKFVFHSPPGFGYYVDGETPIWKNKTICASLVLTEDLCVYLNPQNGNIIVPDHFTEERRIVHYSWLTIEGVQYAIDYQPYDFEESWSNARSMYSKEFWQLAKSDMLITLRDCKIKNILK